MRNFLKLFFILFIAFFFFSQAEKVFAETIRSFESSIVAHQDGSFDVRETIDYDFGSSLKHGIYRDIPKVSQVGDLYRVINIQFNQILRDGIIENYQDNSNDNKASLKIGNANKTISGLHTYTINYQVKNGIGSNYEDHDEIYWNATGDEWTVPINFASAKVTTDFSVLPNKITCYTGISGSKNQNCNFNNQFTTNPVTVYNLKLNEGLTVVAGFPLNTFPKSVLSKKPETTAFFAGIGIFIIGIGMLLNFVLAPLLVIWYLKNKNKKRFGQLVPNFEIPKDGKGEIIPPAEAGTIDTARLDRDDVIATIFDLAIRKYLKIEQIKEKGKIFGLGGKDDYLIKKSKDYKDVEPFENFLLDKLFEERNSRELSSLTTDFYKTFAEMDDAIFKSLVERKYYAKNPKNQRAVLLVFGVMSIFFLSIPLGIVLLFLAKVLNGRTSLGDEIDWKIDGLKLFLKSMDRNYRWQAEQLYIVEKMIPYAIALGYINEYMEQLKIIKPDYNPSWYAGNMAFYAVASSMFYSMNSGFTTHAPSSSSGFSSGGFSGGGGGGGGGGSW